MIGLPGQTEEDLVNDILFYRDMDIDMIGMGPYVVHHDTPLGQEALAMGIDDEAGKLRRIQLGPQDDCVNTFILKRRKYWRPQQHYKLWINLGP